jgi:hypothetical protein
MLTDSIGVFLAIVSIILALSLYMKEVFRVSKKDHKKAISALNIFIFPLLILFSIVVLFLIIS